VAIVAVLAAIVLAVLWGSTGAARGLQCRNRLRQIGAAYHQYLNDSGGLWPPILTSERPGPALERFAADTGLAIAPERPAPQWGQPGPHWSLVLWPYLRSLDIYTCPADPKRSERGAEVVGVDGAHAAAVLGAPPESYALNVVLFRTSDEFRRRAGCTWGTRGDADYSGLASYTTLAEQRRQFPSLQRLILFFCGASGQTVGSQFNTPFRTSGFVERWEWHPKAASAAFADEPGCGSNYLFADGRTEYREALPPPDEWGYRLGLAPPPAPGPPPQPQGPPAPPPQPLEPGRADAEAP